MAHRRPVPHEFTDYRAYLRAMIGYLKASRPQFSYRFFSRVAGLSSPNYLKLVAEGKRNLSHEAIGKFARGLGLEPSERESFETLVLLGQAQTDEDRNRYYRRLQEMRPKRVSATVRLEQAQYKVYSSWYGPAIREMLALDDFREDATWIGARLRPQVRPPEVKQSLRLLEELGLVVRDGEGRLKTSDTTISTGPRVRSLAVRNFHRAMLTLAERSLDTIAPEERDVTALTVPLSRSQFEQVRRKIEDVRREILAVSAETAPDPDTSEIYHVGFLVIPMTRRPK